MQNFFSALKLLNNFVHKQTRSWGTLFSLCATFFVLSVTIINFLHGMFSFNFIPVFQYTFEGFRNFTHWIYANLIFTPFEVLIEFIFSAATKFLRFLGFQGLEIPHIRIPRWYADVVLISTILHRAQTAAMKSSTPFKHESGYIPSAGEQFLWKIVLAPYVIVKALIEPLKKYGFFRAHSFLRLFLGGLTLQGIWFLLHDILVVKNTWGFSSEVAVRHLAFVLFLLLSLISATLASLIFLVLNGNFIELF